jgi:hypothetical protein
MCGSSKINIEINLTILVENVENLVPFLISTRDYGIDHLEDYV